MTSSGAASPVWPRASHQTCKGRFLGIPENLRTHGTYSHPFVDKDDIFCLQNGYEVIWTSSCTIPEPWSGADANHQVFRPMVIFLTLPVTLFHWLLSVVGYIPTVLLIYRGSTPQNAWLRELCHLRGPWRDDRDPSCLHNRFVPWFEEPPVILPSPPNQPLTRDAIDIKHCANLWPILGMANLWPPIDLPLWTITSIIMRTIT